jgi:hypothetical protein
MKSNESNLILRSQFKISPHGIVHEPTNAMFIPNPKDPCSGTECLGNLATNRVSNFNAEDVWRIMRDLWSEYVVANPQLFNHK